MVSDLKVPQILIEILAESGIIITKKNVSLSGASNFLKMDFNLGNQASGLYFVKVVSADGVQIGKVVVQH